MFGLGKYATWKVKILRQSVMHAWVHADSVAWSPWKLAISVADRSLSAVVARETSSIIYKDVYRARAEVRALDAVQARAERMSDAEVERSVVEVDVDEWGLPLG